MYRPREVGACHEQPVGERALLPLLLPVLPWPHHRQARLPASRAHLLAGAGACAQARWARATPLGTLAGSPRGTGSSTCWSTPTSVQPVQAGHHRGLGHQEQLGQPRLLHVHVLHAQRQVYGSLLAGRRSRPGPDEQFLHWPGHAHQLQHLLQLLRLQGELGQTLGEEPLR